MARFKIRKDFATRVYDPDDREYEVKFSATPWVRATYYEPGYGGVDESSFEVWVDGKEIDFYDLDEELRQDICNKAWDTWNGYDADSEFADILDAEREDRKLNGDD